jgi:hypothetical protein
MQASRCLLSLLLLLLPHSTQPRPVFGITAARLEKLSWDAASNQTKVRPPEPGRPPQPPARPRSSLTSGPSEELCEVSEDGEQQRAGAVASRRRRRLSRRGSRRLGTS